MELKQQATTKQTLALTQTMRQSLACLQMSVLELRDYIQEEALSNPLLEISMEDYSVPLSPAGISQRERDDWSGSDIRNSDDGHNASDFTDVYIKEVSFSEHLNQQLGQVKELDERQRSLCKYLIGCLDSRGYLDCDLQDLADESGIPLFDLEQALYVVQMLEPIGVGARSLSENLIIQLANSEHFNEATVHIALFGLELLSTQDYRALAKEMGLSIQQVICAEQVIKALNPIPSRGFAAGEATQYSVPEAEIIIENGQLAIQIDPWHLLPKISINNIYDTTSDDSAKIYIRQKKEEAATLLKMIQNRESTLSAVIRCIAAKNREFFVNGGPLVPLTMQQVAEDLSVNASTISRTVKGKSIQFTGKILPLRMFFSSALQTQSGNAVSAESAKQQIRRFVNAEDKRQPLSDDGLCHALAGIGIVLSRRTIAKYRAELNIPSKSERRQK